MGWVGVTLAKQNRVGDGRWEEGVFIKIWWF
jgi:hypothetical protein